MLIIIEYLLLGLLSVFLATLFFRKYQEKQQDYLLIFVHGFVFVIIGIISEILYKLFGISHILDTIFRVGASALVNVALFVSLSLILFKVKKNKWIITLYLVFSVIFYLAIIFVDPETATFIRGVVILPIAIITFILLVVTYFFRKEVSLLFYAGGYLLIILGGYMSLIEESVYIFIMALGLTIFVIGIYIFEGRGKIKKGVIGGSRLPKSFSKIGPKIIFSFISFSIIFSGVGLYIYYQSIVIEFDKALDALLTTESMIKKKEIDIFFEKHLGQGKRVAEYESVVSYFSQGGDDQRLENEVVSDLDFLLEVDPEIKAVRIFNHEEKNIAVSDLTVNDRGEIFEELTKKNEYIGETYFGSDQKSLYIDIALPVIHEERTIAAAMLRLDISKVLFVPDDVRDFEEKSEVFVINEDHILISKSLFAPDASVLKRKIDTENVNVCLKSDQTTDSSLSPTQFVSYHGQEVYGSAINVPKIGWCVLAEVDKAKAEEKYLSEIILSIVFFSLGAIIIIGFTGFFLSKSITNSIFRLKKGMEVVMKGNLDYRVLSESKDEVGDLSRFFDELVLKLKKSKASVEAKVKARTEEVIKKQEELEKAQRATLNILEDVQKEKERAEYEKERIVTLVKSVGEGLFVTDTEGIITIFNSAATRITGYSEKEAVGKYYGEILKFKKGENENALFSPIEEVLKSRETMFIGGELLLIGKHFKETPISDSIAPIFKGKKVVGTIVVFRDMTKEHEIDRMKSGFVSISSHQLRTPLSAMKWLLEMVINQEVGKLNSEQESYLRQAYESTERLINLVNDLLKVTRLESNRMDIELKSVDLGKMVLKKVADYKPYAEAHNCQLEVKFDPLELPSVEVDEVVISNVFDNLIKNAIDYTKPGEKNIISVAAKKRDDDILISVSDKGIGIPPTEQKRIFEMFYRSDQAIRLRAEGSGLGLYIVRTLIDLSGGEIWFESEQGKGTTFHFTLPLRSSKRIKNAKTT